MAHLPRHLLSRRRFLATTGGAAAGAALLGACGGDDDTESEGSTTTAATSEHVLVRYFDGPLFATGITSRIAFGVGDAEGLLSVEDTPEELEVELVAPDGRTTAEPITVRRHAKGLERAYFPLELVFDQPGIYGLRAQLGGPAGSELAFEVKDAAQVTVVKPGDQMPALETPTTADARGVTPVCTDDPPCPLHDVTLAQALAEGRPLAFLVATPAFCKVFACGPVHQVLLDVLGDHPDVRALHAEVYVHPLVNTDDFAPVLGQLRMFAEPALFLVGSDGVVQHRLDAIYDEDEVSQKLAALT